MPVIFQNKGLIDLQAITTFGVNVKEVDNPIGYFGTGLKYAIAVMLRYGQIVKMYRGKEEFLFHYKAVEIRGKSFYIVFMNEDQLSFTLDLGRNWELWQAYREMHCNTIDENGVINYHPDTVHGYAEIEARIANDHTTFIVLGEDIEKEYEDRTKTILELKDPIYKSSSLEVYDHTSNHLFYRGVRAGTVEHKAQFTYNFIKKMELTEDRTLKNLYSVYSVLHDNIVLGNDRNFIKRFLCTPKNTFESKVDLDWSSGVSNEFRDVMKEITFKNCSNPTAQKVYDRSCKSLVPAVTIINEIEEKQFKKALEICKRFNFPIDKYPIKFTDSMRDNILGMVYNDEIYISRRAFLMGTKMVVGTLIEEYLHIEKGFMDCSREMQNYLFDLLATMMERISGEPI